MEYKIKFTDDIGHESISMPFETEDKAERFIDEDLEKYKNCYKSSNYDYGEFGNKTEFWIKDSNFYASWERLWK